ncbi:TPA: hypothetical protein ACGWRO_003429 [Pseudomonas aeruginosa]
MSMELNKALELLREIRPSIPKEVLELWCKDRDAFLASHPAVEQAGGDEHEPLPYWEPCNLGCDPEFNGKRSRHCAQLCHGARAALAQPSPALPPFAEKVLAKLRRFYDCASDFESGGVDIGRHWLDLLTQLGLLNRVQRSPALWEISQQGEDLLGMPQPSPAQAEAERPEVVAYLFVKPDGTLSMDAVRHKPSQPAVAVMTVAQHERIVGELRADRDSWAEQAEQRLADWDEMRKEHDAALAEVERLRESKGDPVGSLEKCMKVMYERDEHAKRLEVALARVAELEGKLTDWVHEGFRLNEALAVAKAQHSVPDDDMILQIFADNAEHSEQGDEHGYCIVREQHAQAIARKLLAAAPVCRLSRSALTDAQMRRLYDSSTETENERLGFAAFARLIRRAEAVHQIAAAPGKEGV